MKCNFENKIEIPNFRDKKYEIPQKVRNSEFQHKTEMPIVRDKKYGIPNFLKMPNFGEKNYEITNVNKNFDKPKQEEKKQGL